MPPAPSTSTYYQLSGLSIPTQPAGFSTTQANTTKTGDITVSATVTLTWVPAAGQTAATDPAPPSVLLSESSSASWTAQVDHYPDPYTTGGTSADDGLQDAEVATYYAGVKSGGTSSSAFPHYFSQSVTNGVATLSRSFSAHATASSGPSTAGVNFGCSWGGDTLTVYPVFISLSGTLKDASGKPVLDGSGNQQALTGQQITATLTGIPSSVKVTSYTWQPSGSLIKTWDGTNNTQQLFPLLPADLTAKDTTGNGIAVKSLAFYDQVGEAASTSCTVNLKFPDGTTGSLTATSPSVSFVKPTVTWTVGQSYNKIMPGFFTNYPSQVFGANELWGKIVIKEPPALVKNGPGIGCVVQVAKLDRALARTPLNAQPATYGKLKVLNGDGTTSMVAAPTGLDGAFPYPFGSTANANGTFTQTTSDYTWAANTDGYSGDQPTQYFTIQSQDTGGNQWYSSTANDNFNTWVMYRPPANGLGVIYVPLQTLNWSWGGNASLTANVWSVSQGPPFTPGSPSITSAPPSWGLKIPVGLVIGP